MHALDPCEPRDAARLQPIEDSRNARIGAARVGVADVGGEEFKEAISWRARLRRRPESELPEPGQSRFIHQSENSKMFRDEAPYQSGQRHQPSSRCRTNSLGKVVTQALHVQLHKSPARCGALGLDLNLFDVGDDVGLLAV